MAQVKKKTEALKDNRDYSFLLSDDADLSSSPKEKPAARPSLTQRADREVMRTTVQSKATTSQPAHVLNGYGPKNTMSTHRHDEDEEKSEMEEKDQYAKFWNEFGKSIKLGIIKDATNRNRLAKLLRFESTKSDGKLASLDEYRSRMKPGQKDIVYITVSSKEQLEKSPFLERLTKKNYEVIFSTVRSPIARHK